MFTMYLCTTMIIDFWIFLISFVDIIIYWRLLDYASFSNYRSKLNLAAAFVDATDSRYGFSSKDIRKLGGSELSRINDLIASDHGE